jgi:hypothetical protein
MHTTSDHTAMAVFEENAILCDIWPGNGGDAVTPAEKMPATTATGYQCNPLTNGRQWWPISARNGGAARGASGPPPSSAQGMKAPRSPSRRQLRMSSEQAWPRAVPPFSPRPLLCFARTITEGVPTSTNAMRDG